MPQDARGLRARIIIVGIAALVAPFGCSGEIHPTLPVAPTVRHLTVMPVTQARAQTIPTNARDVRIMSFNLRCPTIIDGFNHWNFRKELMIETIRKFDPDVLGTQECVTEQANFLRSNLPDYRFVGAGRNDGKESGEMCGVLFKRDKFDLVDSGTFWLSETPGVPGSKSWGTTFTRLVTWVKLQPNDGGRAFCLFNTHFDVWGKRARLESAKLLRNQISEIAGNVPSIVTGDFNDDAESPTYRTLLAGVSSADPLLVDTFRVAHPRATQEDGTKHSFDGRRDGERIDWIMTTGSFQTIASGIDHTSVDGKYPSDHFPMVAIVRPVTAQNQTARIE